MRLTTSGIGQKNQKFMQEMEQQGITDGVQIECLPGRNLCRTIEDAATMQNPCVTIACNAIHDECATICKLLRANGICNVFVVSGSPLGGPNGHDTLEMIRLLQREGMTVSVGAYPESFFSRHHPRHRREDIDALKRKMDAGASSVVTQTVFRPTLVRNWLQEIREEGILCPVQIGVMAPARPSRNDAQYAWELLARRCKKQHTSLRGIWSIVEMDQMYRLLRSRRNEWFRIARECITMNCMEKTDGIHVGCVTSSCEENLRSLRRLMDA